ncbi:hypothetical protein PVL29_012812 [Vitis rotundifolia]|uniref:Uncharacterized protein n=1 Tax=Vitis rotundifolia TaxID=103349 RepID=A0AA39DQC5_VITRO|nr:hypothetical protein PVL29_012812 [Vitis rotundifolia]
MVEGYNFFMQPLVNIPRLNEEEDWRRTSIFQTRGVCQGKLCTLIIDGGKDHPNPYQIAWVNGTSILVSSHCLVTFNFNNNFELSAWCDENTYTLVHNGCNKILHPMKESPPHKEPKEKLASLKLEEPSNTLTKKQVKVTRKEEEIINDESRKQEVMELILDQPVEELKEVVEASKESMLNFPRPNIITSGGKHEEFVEISFEHRDLRILFFYKTVNKKSMGSNFPQAC